MGSWLGRDRPSPSDSSVWEIPQRDRAGGRLALVAVDPLVATDVDAYLAKVEAEAQGLLVGFYLVGSVAMGDFRGGGRLARLGSSGAASSDIDFVAVTSRPVDRVDLLALERVHRHLARCRLRPALDGMYLTWADLAHGPAGLGERPHVQVHAGSVALPRAATSPVAWHELAERRVACAGPHPTNLQVWTDERALARWCRANLQTYWQRWHQQGHSVLTGPGLSCLTSFGPAWAVLGASRSHHTGRTGRLISKTAAGQYARETFDPRWHRIVDESLRIRTGSGRRSLYRDPVTRRRATLDYVEMVLHSV